MTTSPPNILLICSDQHTARVTGAYGDRVVETPNLDALAAEGSRFDACYCNYPLCVPSRMSYLTGRFPFKCEVTGNGSILDSRQPTLAHVAVRAGYHSALIGKMHFVGQDQHHGYLERTEGEVHSWSTHLAADAKPSALNPALLANCSRPEPLLHVGAGDNAYVDADAYVRDTACGWLRRYAQTPGETPPFFLTVGFILPHCPFIAPPEIYKKYEGRVRAPTLSAEEKTRLHPVHRSNSDFIKLNEMPPENFDKAAVAYYALTDILDQNIGAILDTLRETSMLDNTIIVYFSDHGEMLGQHGRWHKESFYEDSARVPLIVRHPQKKLPPVISQPVSLVDFMPTLCELTGVKPPPNLDGQSLLPLLRGETVPGRNVKSEVYSYWERGNWTASGNRMVRRGPWKLSYYGAFDSCELFNLETDPEEKNNLADAPEFASVVAELKPLLYDDGWHPTLMLEIRERLENTMGAGSNQHEYAVALRRDPLPKDAPEYWRGMGDHPTRVVE